ISGQYKASQVLKGGTVTISGVVYSHPGYKIQGWNTAADKTGAWYYPSEVNTLNADLIIYAQWDPYGYKVQFDPNVPLGETYRETGDMTEQKISFHVSTPLKTLGYAYPGHAFANWNTKADGSGASYANEEAVLNLATQEDEIIILYAQWKICVHDGVGNTFDYIKTSESTMERHCSCEGQVLSISLSANNAVYDKAEHPATLTYESEEWKPNVTYSFKKEGDADYNSTDHQINAGSYKASVTQGTVTIQVLYEIEKAPQDAPEKPSFDSEISTDENKSTLKVKPVADSPNGTVTRYRAVYFENGEQKETDWQYQIVVDGNPILQGEYAVLIDVNVALVSYYVEAQYEGNDNYLDSDPTRGDQKFFFEGGVSVSIIWETGITGIIEKDGGQGILFTAELIDPNKFYYTNGAAVVTVDTVDQVEEGEEGGPKEPTFTKIGEGTYTLTQIPATCEITITISGAEAKFSMTSHVIEKQVFTAFENSSATIARDSAFTAYFEVTGYKSTVYDSSSMWLQFQENIPKDTTIILVDHEENSYWSYRAQAATQKVLLGAFTRMGGTEPFVVKGDTLRYSFVVDHSQTLSGADGSKQTVALRAKNLDVNAPEFVGPAGEGTVEIGLENVRNYSFGAVPSDTQIRLVRENDTAAASKWDDRDEALVFIPSSSIPADAVLEVRTANSQNRWEMNAQGSYIVPMNKIQGDTVTVAIRSSLFPAEETTYTFDVKWIVSNSKAEEACLNGTVAAESSITYRKAKEIVPSLMVRLQGDDGAAKTVYTSADTLYANVSHQEIPVGADIRAEILLRNEEGGYSSTAQFQDLTLDSQTIEMRLGGQQNGSYCLMVIVTFDLETILQVPSYFVIQN
ncbi:MAG: InlB B-repeat-containing protein, partial [Firmicutes bacterium]|nr:InlB B-repeat-containing protein [Bacillota bacterium]